MRTYSDHIHFFDREIERIGHGPFDLSLRSLIEVMAQRWTPEADDACRVFAATLDWPPLTEGVRLEVGLRLMCARAWCAGMTESEGDCDEDGQEFLTELLIAYWRDVGRENWLYDLLVSDS